MPKLYTMPHSDMEATSIPIATAPNQYFTGWVDADTGVKVFDFEGKVIANALNWTDSNKNFILDGDGDLTADFAPIYSVQLDSEDADTEDYTEFYYIYNESIPTQHQNGTFIITCSDSGSISDNG